MRVNPTLLNKFYFYKGLLDLFGKSYSKAYSIGNFAVEKKSFQFQRSLFSGQDHKNKKKNTHFSFRSGKGKMN